MRHNRSVRIKIFEVTDEKKRMNFLTLSSSIENAPMVNEARGKVFRNHGIRTIEDLLWYLPFRYEDWRHPKEIKHLIDGEVATVVGKVTRTHLHLTSRRHFKILEVTIRDSTGSILVRFFNQPYLKDQFEKDRKVILHGTVRVDPFGHDAEMENPHHEILKKEDPSEYLSVRPVYERIASITPKMLRWIVKSSLESIPAQAFGEPLSDELRKKYKLVDRRTAFWQLHFPTAEISLEDLQNRRSQGHRRLIFEEFFLLEVGLAYRQKERPQKKQGVHVDNRVRERVRSALPFKLTEAQKRVIREIVEDMKQEPVMYRLLQGDVGSGKTIIALMASIVAIENGLQVAFMVPTELLAEQHFSNISYLLRNTSYIVRLLVGGQSKKNRTLYLGEIASGACPLVIGTHALIQEGVQFDRLGLVIVDEQHRFGVLQREALVKKGVNPDCLIMTATPIPRSLALTVYGDLETSVLDEMPPGRKPIVTKKWPLKKKAELYHQIASAIRNGKQAYVLCPLIEESEKLQLSAAEKLSQELRKTFPDLAIGLIHGGIPAKDREVIMRDFLERKIQMLVSTTVIEVGIDVANASIMVIEHAERFGLSQLHQLRGRVGRGTDQSYCYLLIPSDSDLTEEAKMRVNAMIATDNGFKIAETDLKIRGPGELTGTRQSGLPTFRIGNLLLDQKILEVARKEGFEYIETYRKNPEVLKTFFQKYWNDRFGLIQVG
jgi:ATP-dependent DNA helicase RecG